MEYLDEEMRPAPEGEREWSWELTSMMGMWGGEGIERIHAGWDVGERNEQGESVEDVVVTHDLALVNTFFERLDNKLVMFSNGGRESQMDFDP